MKHVFAFVSPEDESYLKQQVIVMIEDQFLDILNTGG